MADPAAAAKPTAPTVVEKPPTRRRGRWLKRGGLLLILIGLASWFAPLIVSTSTVRNQLPKYLFPNFQGRIELGEVSLAWMQPVVIKNLQILDEDAQALLTVSSISSTETLWTLLTRTANPGTFKISAPVLHVTLTETDSNLERALSQLAGISLSGTVADGAPTDAEPAATAKKWLLDYVVEIDHARIELDHKALNLQSTIDQVDAHLVSHQGAVEEFDLAIGNPPAAVDPSVQTADWMVLRVGALVENQAATAGTATRQVVLRAAQWKLDRLGPLLPRVARMLDLHETPELQGEFTADTSLALIPSAGDVHWDWQGTVSVENLLMAGIATLQHDKLALNHVELSGRAAATLGRLAMHGVKLSTDVGEFQATGDIPLEKRPQQSAMELVQSLLSDEDYHFDGHVDLKKLAALLPHTLRIREGTEITSGDVKVEFVGVAVDGVRKWSGVAGITGLSAVNQGKTVPWDQPIAARVNAHRTKETIMVDLLECRSDFLQISGQGTLDDARFTASGDLAKLLLNIERFVDLGIDELSGQMKARGELKRTNDGQVELTSSVVLDQFAYVVSKDHIWREPHLELSVIALGVTDDKPMLTTLKTGSIHLIAGRDTLDVQLKSPVDLTAGVPVYAGLGKIKGDLASWQNRLRPVVAFDAWKLAGSFDLSTTLTMNTDQIDVSELTMGVQKFQAQGPEWLIEDPNLKLNSPGKWNRKTQKWTSSQCSLEGKAVTMDVADLECQLGSEGLTSLMGTASYRADLTALSTWKNQAIPNPSYYLIGTLTGRAGIRRERNSLGGSIDAQVEKFILAGQGTGPNGEPKWVALWKEPQVKLSGQGAYDTAADILKLTSTRFDVDGLSASVQGELDAVSTTQQISITGDLAYDWDLLSKRFGAQLAQQVRLTGQDQRQFILKGSLAAGAASPATAIPASTVSFQPRSVTPAKPSSSNGLIGLGGQAGIGWKTASVYGFSAGAGDLSTQLERGVCRFAPLDVVVNDGKLHLTPTIYLDRDPFLLVLPSEKLIDQLSLTPELCSNSLKYIAPMLADSTQVEGKLSVDLEGAELPLLSPLTGRAQGVLSIHRAQAKPGPMSMQLVGSVEQIRSILTRKQPGNPNPDQVWIEMSEQQIPFKFEQGRMYHEGMTFVVQNVSVKTRGSVGMDNSLDLIAEIPFKDEWLGNGKVLAGMKGKSIQIPITGTTSRPQVDPRVFADLTRQLGGAALDGLLQDKAGGDLNDAINNGLDKLLRGKKK